MNSRTPKPQDSWEKNYKDSRRVITSEEWETQRNNFTRLYITKDFELEKVRQIMAESYGFFANKKQCKATIKKWGLEKYLSKSKVAAMLHIQQKRARQGKKTEFRLGGQLIKEERLERVKKRYRREERSIDPGSNINNMEVTTDTSLMGIEYSTPKPIPSPSDVADQQMEIPSTVIFIHDNLDLLNKRNIATSFPTASSAFPPTLEADNESLLTNFNTPFHTHDSGNLSISSQNLYIPLLSTPEESHSKSDDISPPPPPPPPAPAALNPQPLIWDSLPSDLNASLGLMGGGSYHVGIPPPIDYSTVVRGTMRIDDSNMQMCLKDEIHRIKEYLAEKSERLAALMEEERLLSGLGGYSKVTLTLNLVKDKDMLESDLSRRYKAEQLVVLGWQRGARS